MICHGAVESKLTQSNPVSLTVAPDGEGFGWAAFGNEGVEKWLHRHIMIRTFKDQNIYSVIQRMLSNSTLPETKSTDKHNIFTSVFI